MRECRTSDLTTYICSDAPVPAPAATPGHIPAAVPSAGPQSAIITTTTPEVRRGRIRVVASSPNVNASGYVANVQNALGHYNKCGLEDTSLALQVEYETRFDTNGPWIHEIFTVSLTPSVATVYTRDSLRHSSQNIVTGERLGVTWPSLPGEGWLNGDTQCVMLNYTVIYGPLLTISSAERSSSPSTQMILLRPKRMSEAPRLIYGP